MGKTFRQMVADARGAVGVVSPQDAKQEIDKGNATVIDVREPDEVAAGGTVPGARNIPRGVLEIKADTELPMRDPSLEDRNQKMLIVCARVSCACGAAVAIASPVAGSSDVSG